MMRGLRDTQIWLPGLFVPDFVLFPRCQARLLLADSEAQTTVEHALQRESIVNVFWVQRQETGPEEKTWHVATVGTLAKITRVVPLPPEDVSSPSLAVELKGLLKVQCDEVDTRLPIMQTRFRILLEETHHGRHDWEQLMEAIMNHLIVVTSVLDPERLVLLHWMERQPVETIINRLCMQLPFEPAVKQQLLEMPSAFERGQALRHLLETVAQALQNTQTDPSTPLQ